MSAETILIVAAIISAVVGIFVDPMAGAGVFSFVVSWMLLTYVAAIVQSLKKLEAYFSWHQRIEDFRFRQQYPNALEVLKSEQQTAREKRDQVAANGSQAVQRRKP